MEREYRILIDVGKFAVDQTDWWFFVCLFFFFPLHPASPWCCAEGAGRAMPWTSSPGPRAVPLQAQRARSGSRPTARSQVRAAAASLRNPRKEGKRGDPRWVSGNRIEQNGSRDFIIAVFFSISLFLYSIGLNLGLWRNHPRKVFSISLLCPRLFCANWQLLYRFLFECGGF